MVAARRVERRTGASDAEAVEATLTRSLDLQRFDASADLKLADHPAAIATGEPHCQRTDTVIVQDHGARLDHAVDRLADPDPTHDRWARDRGEPELEAAWRRATDE